ncbi:MAG TPA: type II toxin-antitoxin system RelE/ParE family toxin, partial [Alphaproteobacteria bacterium]|nr:type II toxin-antitoxin system RelE/ParE family toxin [Alphaproteobacteria bacterium]
EWLGRIPASHALRVSEALYRMEYGNFGDHKSVGDGVMERRIFGSPALRIYYGMNGKDLVILLAGGGKNKQSKDIEKAKALWAAYKADSKT